MIVLLWKAGTLLGVDPVPCSHHLVHVLGNCHSRTNQRHFSHYLEEFPFVCALLKDHLCVAMLLLRRNLESIFLDDGKRKEKNKPNATNLICGKAIFLHEDVHESAEVIKVLLVEGEEYIREVVDETFVRAWSTNTKNNLCMKQVSMSVHSRLSMRN